VIAVLGLAGLVVFVLASLVVGLRIVLLATRTGGVPEWTVGLSLLFAGAIGTGLSILPVLLHTTDQKILFGVDQAASIFSHIGYGLLFVFVWRVFRPTATWAKGLFTVLIGALVVSATGIALTLEPGVHLSGPNTIVNHWSWLGLGTRMVGYLWAAIESFRYYGMLQRRIAIGIGDERTAYRFLQWGICTTAVVGIWICIAIAWSIPEVSADWTQVATALLGFIVAGSLWQAFFSREKAELNPA